LQPQNKIISVVSGPIDVLKTGEIMVKEGMIRLDDIDTVLSIQKKRQNSVSLEKNRLFGMVLCDLNLITPLDNYCVLHKHKKLISVQSALVIKRMLSQDMVMKTLKESQNSGIPFLSSLINKKLILAAAMQTLLFDLFHIPYRSISDFIFNDKDRDILVRVLDKPTSMDKKILPLMIKNNTLLFGITDPENILFIHQLNDRFPQYRFKAIVALPDKKPLDLSLLLNFKTSIQEPEKEKDAILSLYHRYEQLRLLTENPKRRNLQNEFIEFIIHHHRNLMTKYQSHSIEFTLKKDDTGVKVVAFPEK